MIIKAIKIDGFGKHKDLYMDFSEGLNVVYGSNEVGKSTMQAFIKAMFYGLNSRNRSISDNPRKKYSPWNSDVMGGEILFSNNNIEYSLVRRFGETRGKDKITLSYVSSGEQIPVDSKSEPGDFLFNISQSTFESTLFVGQLDSKIDSSTAKDSSILSKLSNLAGTGDENVDINFIENNLEKSIRSLHAAKGKNGYIDKLKFRLSELREERDLYNEAKNSSLKIIEDLNVYNARKASIIDEINRYKDQLRATASHKSLTEFEKIRTIRERKGKQEQMLEELRESLTINGTAVDRAFYEKCIADFNKIEEASAELSAPAQILDNAKETVSVIDKHLSNLEYLNHFNLEAFEDIHSLKIELSRSIEKKSSLDLKLTDAMIDLEAKKERTKLPKNFITILSILSAVIAAAGISGILLLSGAPTVSYILFALAGISLISAFVFFTVNNKSIKKNKFDLIYAEAEVKNLNDMLNSIQSDISTYISNKSESTQNKFKEVLGIEPISANNLDHKYTVLNSYMASTLNSINCTSIDEIKEKLTEYRSYKMRRQEAMDTVSSLLEVYNAKEKISCDVTSDFYNKYSSLFSLSSIDGIKETLRDIFHDLNKYDSLITDFTYSEEFLKNALAGRSYEKMEREALSAQINEPVLDPELSSDPAFIKETLEALDKDLDNIKDAISDTNIRIASNFKSFREEHDILNDINEILEIIDRLEHQYDAMNVAKTFIKESFNEIQQSFGPKLNDRASEILNSIKPDNPVNIKVNRDFNITLSPKNSLLPYEIDYFSYGAQDQAYFALRMAISDILSADFEGFPLLLDDPFVQYDEKRMQGALDFLSDVSKSRQVFIFTCHKNVFSYSSGIGGNCFELKQE